MKVNKKELVFILAMGILFVGGISFSLYQMAVIPAQKMSEVGNELNQISETLTNEMKTLVCGAFNDEQVCIDVCNQNCTLLKTGGAY